MLRLTAELLPGAAASAWSDGGRALPAPVQPAPPSEITLFETPGPIRPGAAAVWVLARGGAGWQGAEIRLLDAGLETSLGRVGAPLAWGRLAAPLAVGPETLWDEAGEVLMDVDAGVSSFESRAPMAVLSGANVALVGEELIQFREALPAGEGRLKLAGLLRGRFGTRPAPHGPGAIVQQLRPDLLASVAVGADAIGRTIEVLALGAGDPAGGSLESHLVEGLGVGPMGPVHLRVQRDEDGAIASRWLPRAREAFDWGGAEPPAASFVWRFAAATGGTRDWVVSGPAFDLSVAMQVAGWVSPLPEGEVWVLAVGEGPESRRASGPVWLGAAS